MYAMSRKVLVLRDETHCAISSRSHMKRRQFSFEDCRLFLVPLDVEKFFGSTEGRKKSGAAKREASLMRAERL